MNGYELSRKWFDWCFENTERISPNHTALYFFIIEHCNRLGWKQNFGLPTTMAKEAIGIRSYNTYINTLNDLVGFGFIELIERSKNQYSSNIVAISNFDNTLNNSLDKAIINHASKQSESTVQSISSIDKPITINKETNNHKPYWGTLDISLINYEFKDCVMLWLKYKAERKEKYTQTGFEQMLKKLYKLSGNNPEKAKKILEESMGSNYAGFFQLKEDKGIQKHQDRPESKIAKFVNSVKPNTLNI